MNGNELRELRHSLNLSKEDFAEFIGLTGAHSWKLIQQWETGARPIEGVAARLIEFIDLCEQIDEWPDFVLDNYPSLVG